MKIRRGVTVVKNIKKDTVTFTFGKYKATAQRDFETFSEGYAVWNKTCGGLKGSAIGVSKTKKSLLDLVQGIGREGRSTGTSSPANSMGWNDIGRLLQQIFSMRAGREIKQEQLDLLKNLDIMLENHSKPNSPANPANIKFEEPMSWNEETGKVVERRDVFGHYLTDDYVEYRNEFKDANLTAVDSEWYSYQDDGSAKPPMWQALFSTSGILGKESKGLHQVVKDAISHFDGLELSFRKETPIPIEGRGSGAAALKIPEIKSMFTAFARDTAFTTPAGNFSTTKAKTIITRTPINIANKQQANVLRSIESDLKIPNDIEEVYITMSRRQMKNMAVLAGWKPPVKEEPKTEEPEDTVRTSADIEHTDWKTIMKVNV